MLRDVFSRFEGCGSLLQHGRISQRRPPQLGAGETACLRLGCPLGRQSEAGLSPQPPKCSFALPSAKLCGAEARESGAGSDKL